jgi:hypothetical protein
LNLKSNFKNIPLFFLFVTLYQIGRRSALFYGINNIETEYKQNYYVKLTHLKETKMAQLFIIGNGFDLSHGLLTSYQGFRSYLLSNYPNIKMDELVIPEGKMLPDGDLHYDEEETISMLFYFLSVAEGSEEKWKDIEKSLGNLDFSEAFDWHDDFFDNDGDIDLRKTSYRNEDIASNLIIPTKTIQRFFSEWINSIKINSVKPKIDFIKILKDGDQFLTFNYTGTLEDVYDIDKSNICHIHGKQNEEIFFGHGNEEDYYESYMQRHIGSENGLNQIDRQLRKRTDIALQKNIDFFINLEALNINKIYSYGFSFGEVDTVYLKEICRQVKTEEVTWYFNDHDISLVGERILLLKECGFKGDFNTFHIR